MIRLLHPVPEGAREIVLEGERHHHLVHVLRAEIDDELEVFDGQGRSYAARIVELSEESARLVVEPPRVAPPLRRVTLIQGLPKGEKLEWVLQKCTELGAAAFRPVFTRRTVVKLTADRAADRARRWTKIAEEAARQSGRSDVPEVHAPVPLQEAIAALPPGTHVFVLDEEERSRSLRERFSALRADPAEVALVIGPEGGLDRAEVEALLAAGAQPVTLGTRVLRTETAPIVALTIVLLLDGALG